MKLEKEENWEYGNFGKCIPIGKHEKYIWNKISLPDLPQNTKTVLLTCFNTGKSNISIRTNPTNLNTEIIFKEGFSHNLFVADYKKFFKYKSENEGIFEVIGFKI